MSAIVLSQADNGKSIELSQGQTLFISLSENPTTGYRWSVDSTNIVVREANTEVITLENSNYEPATDVGVGGGGKRTFMFKAASTGIIQLQLKLWQPWEGDRSVVERYSLTIQVHG